MLVLRSSGAQNVVVMDLASTAEFASLAAFRAAVLAAPLSVDLAGPSVSYRNVRGQVITASWGPFNPASQIIESFPRLTVNGQPQPARSASVIESGPISLSNRRLKVKVPTGSLSVDWRGSKPVFGDAPAPAPPPTPTPPPAPAPAPPTLTQRIAGQLPCSLPQASQAISLCAARCRELKLTAAAEQLEREARL